MSRKAPAMRVPIHLPVHLPDSRAGVRPDPPPPSDPGLGSGF
jgi:hypothetical protein